MVFGSYQKLERNDADIEAGYSPPAYDGPPQSSSSSSSPYPPHTTLTLIPTATNHVSVVHNSMKIKGTYIIDTSIVTPSLARLFPKVQSSTAAAAAAAASGPNAFFKTKKKDIELSLQVKGGKKAKIVVETDGNGHVWVDFPDRELGTPLDLKVSGVKHVKLSLPSSFRGPIAGGSTSGPLQFSDAWKKLGVTTFAVDQENPSSGKYFIGDWEGWEGEWKGDRLMVTSEKGNVIIETYEEKKSEEEARANGVGEPWGRRVMRAHWRLLVAAWGVPVATWGLIISCVNLG